METFTYIDVEPPLFSCKDIIAENIETMHSNLGQYRKTESYNNFYTIVGDYHNHERFVKHWLPLFNPSEITIIKPISHFQIDVGSNDKVTNKNIQ